jgi:hypothetical protein
MNIRGSLETHCLRNCPQRHMARKIKNLVLFSVILLVGLSCLLLGFNNNYIFDGVILLIVGGVS